MSNNSLGDKILSDLYYNMPVSYSKYGIDKEKFQDILNELQDKGYLFYTKIENHPLFEGEPKHIYITEDGKKFVNQNEIN